MIRRLTSAGSDNDAPPIRDLHCEVEEKGLIGVLEIVAGAKDSGNRIEAPRGHALRQFDLIIMVWANVYRSSVSFNRDALDAKPCHVTR
jgi:hypothetical protein